MDELINKMNSEKQIKQITLIMDTGLVLHDEYLTREKKKSDRSDSDLYGGFIASVIAFSSELGSELLSIKRAEDIIYLFKEKNLIFVLRASSDLKKDEIDRFFQVLTKQPLFKEISLITQRLTVVDDQIKTKARILLEEVLEQFVEEQKRKEKKEKKKTKLLERLWFNLDD